MTRLLKSKGAIAGTDDFFLKKAKSDDKSWPKKTS